MKQFLSILFFIGIFSQLTVCQDITDSLTVKNNSKQLVYKFAIKQEIGPAVWRHTQQSFDEAEKLNADYVLIHMNTYGGLVDMADSIRTRIVNSKIPVFVFIDNNAASAGALISIACDSIYMRKGSNIGAATVVSQSGEVVPDKYQSYMRSMMRSTAESHGKDTIIMNGKKTSRWFRDPQIAEAMVDPRISIAGVIDSGRVLTFTASEAMLHGFCEGQAENVEEVLKLAGINNYEIKEYIPTQVENVMSLLVNPYLHSLLIMVMMGGIYFELQSPGVGFPLLAAIFAAILYFAPLYLEGLAENWEMLVFLLGIVLIALEVFAIPGFGVAGVSGIALVVIGLATSMVNNEVFNFDGNGNVNLLPLIKPLFIVVVSLFLSLLISIYAGQKLLKENRLLSFAVLNSTQKTDEGYVSKQAQTELIGRTAVAFTVLRPAGKILIDNILHDATSLGSFIEKGETVEILEFKTGQLYVRKA